jgi:hypothetical protein
MDNNNSIREIIIISGDNTITKTTASSLDGMTWYINCVGNDVDKNNVNKTMGLNEFIEYLKTIEGVQTVEVRTRYDSWTASELLDMNLEGARIRISKEYNEDGFCCWHFYAVFKDELEVRLEDWNGDKEFISDWTRFFDAVSAIINNL